MCLCSVIDASVSDVGFVPVAVAVAVNVAVVRNDTLKFPRRHLQPILSCILPGLTADADHPGVHFVGVAGRVVTYSAG
jgi:hypothetical protein